MKRGRIGLKGLVGLWLLCCATLPVAAQQPAMQLPDTLPNTVVNATRSGRVNADGSIRLFADEYGHYPAAGLGLEALFQQAEGLYLQDYGGHSGVKTLSMRGFATNQSTLSVQGIPLVNAQLGLVNLGNYFSPAFGELTVDPASGNPAQPLLAGNADLSIGHCAFTWKAAAGLGSWGMRTATAQHNRVGKRTDLYAGWHYTAAEDTYPYTQEGVTARRQQAQYENHQAWLRAVHRFSDTHALEYVMLGYANAQNIPPPVVKARAAAAPSRLVQQNLFHFVRWHHTPKQNKGTILPAKHTLALKQQYDNMTIAPTQWYLNRNWHLQYEAKGKLLQTERFLWMYHLVGQAATTDLRSNHIAQEGTPLRSVVRDEAVAAVRQHLAYKLHARHRLLGQLTTRAQLSNDFDYRPATAAHLRYTYKARKWEISPLLHLTQGYRLPSFNELYFRDFGNSGLRPERARQLDAGAVLTLDAPWPISIKGLWFTNETHDKIISIPLSPVQWSTFALGRTRSSGTEWSLSVQPLPQLEVYANHTQMLAVDESVSEGALLPYTPRELLRTGAIWTEKRWTMGVQLNYTSWRFSSLQASPLTYLAPYTLVDAWVRYRQPLRKLTLEASLMGRNLLNTQYEVIKAFPMPGRNGMVQLAVYW